jgi:fermentation-respiration switch protein FrsA (DUF1100 family)
VGSRSRNNLSVPRKISAPKIALTVFLMVTGLYLVCVVGLTLGQRRLMYFPCRTDVSKIASSMTEAGFEKWRNAHGELIGWVRRSPERTGKSVILFHGNAGCAPGWTHYADGLQAVAKVDFYIVEYPGYGGRVGKPSQRSILNAADNAVRSVEDHCRLYVVGESLGTGPACYVAGKYDRAVAGILLVAPYNNMRAVAQSHLPLFPVRWMLKDKYTSDAWLSEYHGPLATILAENDTVVPHELGQKLFDGYLGPKKLWLEPGASHDDVHQFPTSLWNEIVAFWANSSR